MTKYVLPAVPLLITVAIKSGTEPFFNTFPYIFAHIHLVTSTTSIHCGSLVQDILPTLGKINLDQLKWIFAEITLLYCTILQPAFSSCLPELVTVNQQAARRIIFK